MESENIDALKEKIAKLESRLDVMETEFSRLDRMLKDFGFEEGIKTLAETLGESLELFNDESSD